MKNAALAVILASCLFVACAMMGGPKEESIMDEGTGEIVPDQPTEENTPVVKDESALADRESLENRRVVLIKRYFHDDSTYVIVCKGYPKEGSAGKTAIDLAREAALINAQMIAKERFTIDVVKHGIVEKYTDFEGYSVIYYKVKFPNLKRYHREESPPE